MHLKVFINNRLIEEVPAYDARAHEDVPHRVSFVFTGEVEGEPAEVIVRHTMGRVQLDVLPTADGLSPVSRSFNVAELYALLKA